MRQLLAGALLLLAACAQPSPGTGATPAPAAEIAFLDEPSGGYSIVQTRTGNTVRRLPAGHLALALSSGADVAEAYLVVRTPVGGTEVDALGPAQGFAPSRVAGDPREPAGALLLDAPGLGSFVGRNSVLVVSFGNGDLAGYQHGTRIWSDALPGPNRVLLRVGGMLFTSEGGSWRPIALESGLLGPSATDCSPGPVAEVGGKLVVDCGGVLNIASAQVPPSGPRTFALGDGASLLLFGNGELWRVDPTAARRIGAVTPAVATPVLSPDQKTLYVPVASGIEAFDVASGRVRIQRLPGAASLALSRDGNYFYVLAGGMLATYATGSGNRLGFFPVTGDRIRLVAGG